jgi:hypothetical protein
MIVRVALVLALIAAPWTSVAETGASGLVIEIKDGQLVTMEGQAPSLARLLADLCTRTGATLRGYEAGDRPITVSYEDVPLREVLQRMLRDETYMIGVHAGRSSKNGASDVEVSWVHVTGSKSGTPPSGAVAIPPPLPATPTPTTTKVPSSMTGFGVAPGVITQALGSQNADERRAATREIAERLEENPGELDMFLDADMGSAADELADFPFATEALRTFAIRQKDPVARAKLDAFAKTVDLRRKGLVNKSSLPQKMQQEMQQGMPH